MTLRLRINWAAEAEARGFIVPPCHQCEGHGTVEVSRSDVETCRECDGSGDETGECPCGIRGPLVPLDALLVCERCAASCPHCGERPYVRGLVHEGDQLCRECWEAFAAQEQLALVAMS